VWASRALSFLGQSIVWKFGSQQLVAVGVIMFFVGLNCLRVTFGGAVQLVLTGAKILAIAVIVAGVFFFAPTASWAHLRAPSGAVSGGLPAFGAAMLSALWAYDGWNNMPMAAGEVRNPGRNIPRALILGMAIVLLVYGLVNLAYCYALPISEIASSSSTLHGTALPVAAKAAQTFLPHYGVKLVALAALLSTIGVLNGSLLTAARIPYAMARDGLFFARFAQLNEKSSAPVASIIFTGLWSSVLALSATFDQLTDSVIFAGMIFYGATTAGVLVLRRKMPDAPRPYRTLGYPVVPLLFVLVAAWLLVNTVITSALVSLAGLVLIAAGLPLYFVMQRGRARAALIRAGTV
jgi:APA family basic amino acid/polyamine antiporter